MRKAKLGLEPLFRNRFGAPEPRSLFAPNLLRSFGLRPIFAWLMPWCIIDLVDVPNVEQLSDVHLQLTAKRNTVQSIV